MSKAVFKSKLAPLIRLFIQTKQSRDLPYLVGERILMEFDRMIAEFFPDEATVTKEIVSAWLKHNSHLHINTQIRKISPIRQLSRFIQATGRDAYLCPENEPGKGVHYQPHLITEWELKAFLLRLIGSLRKARLMICTLHFLSLSGFFTPAVSGAAN